jgi:hypothetical protein
MATGPRERIGTPAARSRSAAATSATWTAKCAVPGALTAAGAASARGSTYCSSSTRRPPPRHQVEVAYPDLSPADERQMNSRYAQVTGG